MIKKKTIIIVVVIVIDLFVYSIIYIVLVAWRAIYVQNVSINFEKIVIKKLENVYANGFT